MNGHNDPENPREALERWPQAEMLREDGARQSQLSPARHVFDHRETEMDPGLDSRDEFRKALGWNAAERINTDGAKLMTSFEERLNAVKSRIESEPSVSKPDIWREVGIEEPREGRTPTELGKAEAMAQMHVPPPGGEASARPEAAWVEAREAYAPLDDGLEDTGVHLPPAVDEYTPLDAPRDGQKFSGLSSNSEVYAPLDNELEDALSDIPQNITGATYAPLDGIDAAPAPPIPFAELFADGVPAAMDLTKEEPPVAVPAAITPIAEPEPLGAAPKEGTSRDDASKPLEMLLEKDERIEEAFKPKPMGDLPMGETVEDTYKEAMRLVDSTAKKYRRPSIWLWWLFAMLAAGAVGWWLINNLR